MRNILKYSFAALALIGLVHSPAEAQRSTSASTTGASAARTTASASNSAASAAAASRASSASRAASSSHAAAARSSASARASYSRAASSRDQGLNRGNALFPVYYYALFFNSHNSSATSTTSASPASAPLATSNNSCLYMRFAAEKWDAAPLRGNGDAVTAKISKLNDAFKEDAAGFKAKAPVSDKRLLAAGLSCNLAR